LQLGEGKEEVKRLGLCIRISDLFIHNELFCPAAMNGSVHFQ
jgi:hypothetical protein